MKEIIDFLVISINKYSKITIDNISENIFEYDISPLDMLYVVDELEKEYQVSTREIFHNFDYKSFTIASLAEKIHSFLSVS